MLKKIEFSGEFPRSLRRAWLAASSRSLGPEFEPVLLNFIEY
jgi:hypothetical protein